MLTFFTVCFGVGVAMSVISFLGGALDLHLPHRIHFHVGHHHHHGIGKPGDAQLPYLNSAALVVFLSLFGGTGALLEMRHLVPVVTVGAALLAGFAGGAMINGVLRALTRNEKPLQHVSYVGTVARVIVPIREGGTGEIVFSLQETRRAAGARSESGAAITRDTEVIVTRFENGLAYVRPLSELLDPHEL